MSYAFQPSNEFTMNRALTVQELVLPFVITANATPASKTVTVDNPSMLFLATEGVSRLTLAAGAVDTAAELSAITFATATDSTGVFNALVRVGQTVGKVLSAQVVQRGSLTGEQLNCGFPTGATSGISSLGDKIVLNIDSAKDFGATSLDAVLIVRYTIS